MGGRWPCGWRGGGRVGGRPPCGWRGGGRVGGRWPMPAGATALGAAQAPSRSPGSLPRDTRSLRVAVNRLVVISFAS